MDREPRQDRDEKKKQQRLPKKNKPVLPPTSEQLTQHKALSAHLSPVASFVDKPDSEKPKNDKIHAETSLALLNNYYQTVERIKGEDCEHRVYYMSTMDNVQFIGFMSTLDRNFFQTKQLREKYDPHDVYTPTICEGIYRTAVNFAIVPESVHKYSCELAREDFQSEIIPMIYEFPQGVDRDLPMKRFQRYFFFYTSNEVKENELLKSVQAGQGLSPTSMFKKPAGKKTKPVLSGKPVLDETPVDVTGDELKDEILSLTECMSVIQISNHANKYRTGEVLLSKLVMDWHTKPEYKFQFADFNVIGERTGKLDDIFESKMFLYAQAQQEQSGEDIFGAKIVKT